jgi:hypothetical protein
MHFYEPGAFEAVRISYLLANRKAVVAEQNPSEFVDPDVADGLVAVPYDELVSACASLVADEARRRNLEDRGFVAFSARDETTILGRATTESSHRASAERSSPAGTIAIRERILVIYNYFERDAIYRDNLRFFIEAGISPEKIDYVFTVNGECSVPLPEASNIRHVRRANAAFDFGAYSEAIETTELDKYDYFFFVNCSARGPFLPPHNQDSWTQPFLRLITEDIKLVGPTINILHSASPYAEQFAARHPGFRRPYSHVQSMMFTMDRACMRFLTHRQFFSRTPPQSKDEIIFDYEILMSQLVLANGWNIACMFPAQALVREYGRGSGPFRGC